MESEEKVSKLDHLYARRDKLESQFAKLKDSLADINNQIEIEEAREIKNILLSQNYTIADLKVILSNANNLQNHNLEGEYIANTEINIKAI